MCCWGASACSWGGAAGSQKSRSGMGAPPSAQLRAPLHTSPAVPVPPAAGTCTFLAWSWGAPPPHSVLYKEGPLCCEPPQFLFPAWGSHSSTTPVLCPPHPCVWSGSWGAAPQSQACLSPQCPLTASGLVLGLASSLQTWAAWGADCALLWHLCCDLAFRSSDCSGGSQREPHCWRSVVLTRVLGRPQGTRSVWVEVENPPPWPPAPVMGAQSHDGSGACCAPTDARASFRSAHPRVWKGTLCQHFRFP